jgi:hypothetical protein
VSLYLSNKKIINNNDFKTKKGTDCEYVVIIIIIIIIIIIYYCNV